MSIKSIRYTILSSKSCKACSLVAAIVEDYKLQDRVRIVDCFSTEGRILMDRYGPALPVMIESQTNRVFIGPTHINYKLKHLAENEGVSI